MLMASPQYWKKAGDLCRQARKANELKEVKTPILPIRRRCHGQIFKGQRGKRLGF